MWNASLFLKEWIDYLALIILLEKLSTALSLWGLAQSLLSSARGGTSRTSFYDLPKVGLEAAYEYVALFDFSEAHGRVFDQLFNHLLEVVFLLYHPLAGGFLNLNDLPRQEVHSLSHLLNGKQGVHEKSLDFLDFLLSLWVNRRDETLRLYCGCRRFP